METSPSQHGDAKIARCSFKEHMKNNYKPPNVARFRRMSTGAPPRVTQRSSAMPNSSELANGTWRKSAKSRKPCVAHDERLGSLQRGAHVDYSSRLAKSVVGYQLNGFKNQVKTRGHNLYIYIYMHTHVFSPRLPPGLTYGD